MSAKGGYYFPFYYQRFYSSTHGWTEEEEGAYMRLLTYQFDKGFIPGDLKKIKKISQKAAKNWSLFESKFDKNSDGNFINPVMDEIRNKINKVRERNRLNGENGGRPPQKEKPSGLILGSENETQKKPIPITNNQSIDTKSITNSNSDATTGGLSSDQVQGIAKKVFNDTIWMDATGMGHYLTRDELTKWLAQFNASLIGDNIEGFNERRYKKMFGGWLNKQRSKGYELPKNKIQNGSVADEYKDSMKRHGDS